MDLGLTGKRVAISGATRGIGRATATAFVDEGARAAITCHSDAQAAARAVADLGSAERALAVPLAPGEPASIEAAVRTVEGTWGGVDVVVANASRSSGSTQASCRRSRTCRQTSGPAPQGQRRWPHAHRARRARRYAQARLGPDRAAVVRHRRPCSPGSEIYGAAKPALHGFFNVNGEVVHTAGGR
ncbi:SDR family NAD(P)-dependent oxidoreductase [Streptomyces hygroscopicus]|uniref:SDR family NAD(P)-dependent oxidoreductase n=1 Tax=Streptomyces hygroscopicus TaxID=1912 RepID=UPI00223FCF89|nr:SDR family NAD(P)-dependent oxidoreductase [Streptomyces hygroscopicus]